jgi:hypothetical protein
MTNILNLQKLEVKAENETSRGWSTLSVSCGQN